MDLHARARGFKAKQSGCLQDLGGGTRYDEPIVANRILKPWESGSVSLPSDASASTASPAPVDFEDVDMDFDEDSIEYASAAPPLPPMPDFAEESPPPDDDDFEGVHTNVTNLNELKDWLGGAPPELPPLPSGEKGAWDPDATSLVSGVDMGALLNAARRSVSQDQPPVQTPSAEENAFTVSGSLAAFGLGELLQLFATSRRTGALALAHENDSGHMFMHQGEVYAADWGGEQPEDPHTVMRLMARMTEGEFRFGPLTDDPPPANVNMSMPQLLILLLGDDDDDLGAGLQLDAPVTLPERMTEPLSSLDAEELDTLQLMHNEKTLEQAMTVDGVDPDRLKEVVALLLERGYLVRLEFLENEDDFFGAGMF